MFGQFTLSRMKWLNYLWLALLLALTAACEPQQAQHQEVTQSWYFAPIWSPDGEHVAYLRREVQGMREPSPADVIGAFGQRIQVQDDRLHLMVNSRDGDDERVLHEIVLEATRGVPLLAKTAWNEDGLVFAWEQTLAPRIEGLDLSEPGALLTPAVQVTLEAAQAAAETTYTLAHFATVDSEPELRTVSEEDYAKLTPTSPLHDPLELRLDPDFRVPGGGAAAIFILDHDARTVRKYLQDPHRPELRTLEYSAFVGR